MICYEQFRPDAGPNVLGESQLGEPTLDEVLDAQDFGVYVRVDFPDQESKEIAEKQTKPGRWEPL